MKRPLTKWSGHTCQNAVVTIEIDKNIISVKVSGSGKGWPMSAMLYILVSEILAYLTRENKSIQGIVVNNDKC